MTQEEEPTQVAIVTGGNKGIGYAIVKGLATQFEGYIYLTARNADLGNAAILKIKQEVGNKLKCKQLRFHQLDITDEKSVETFQSYIRNTHKIINILVNNAGIAFKGDSTASAGEQARVTVGCNFFGTLSVCKALLRFLAPHGRCVNICSSYGSLKLVPGEELRNKLSSATLDFEALVEIAKQFVTLAQTGEHTKHGFPNSSYCMSKVLEIAMTRIQQKKLGAFESKPGVSIMACCPGYVDTDMSSHKGKLSIDEGADTPLYLALLPKGETKHNGEFTRRREVIPWDQIEGI